MVQDIEMVNSGNITTITSFELANISGRRHDVLIKSIERMNEDLIQMNRPPAVEDIYTSKNNIKSRQYILSIYHCELLAMALDGIARIKVLDMPMGRTKAFQRLRDEGFIMKNSTLPYQHWVDKKMFEVKEVIIITPKGDKINFTTLITGQGQFYLLDRLRTKSII